MKLTVRLISSFLLATFLLTGFPLLGRAEEPGVDRLVDLLQAFPSDSATNPETFIKITGTKSLAYRAKFLLSGTPPARFYPYSTRTDGLKLNVRGKLKGKYDISGNVFDTDIPDEDEIVSFNIEGPNLRAYLGDYTASFEGSELTLTDRQLTGAKIWGKVGRYQGTGLYSTPRGNSRLEKLTGNNTQGPYQLAYIPVVSGSERVKVGRGLDLKLVRKGIDYEIEYEDGRITFLKRSVHSEETIEVEYESKKGGSLLKEGLWATRGRVQVSPNITVSGTYVRQGEDPTPSALTDTTSLGPKRKEIREGDIELNMGPLLKLVGEFAHNREQCELGETVSHTSGSGYRLESESEVRGALLRGLYRRLGTGFTPIGSARDQPNSRIWESNGVWPVWDPLTLHGGYRREEDPARREVECVAGVNTQLPWSSRVSYDYRAEDGHEVGSGKRWARNHSVMFAKEFRYIVPELSWGYDARSDQGDVSTIWHSHIASAGLKTNGVNWLLLSAKGQAESGKSSQGASRGRYAYEGNLSFIPNRRFVGTCVLALLRDSDAGNSSTTKVDYRIAPFAQLKTDGKYSLEMIGKRIGSTDGVRTYSHTASFGVELKPFKSLAFSYRPQSKIVDAAGLDTRIANSQVHRAGCAWRPVKYISSEARQEWRTVLMLNTSEDVPTRPGSDNSSLTRKLAVKVAPTEYATLKPWWASRDARGLYRADTTESSESRFKTEWSRQYGFDTHLRVGKGGKVEVETKREEVSKIEPENDDTRTTTDWLDLKLLRDLNRNLTATVFLGGNSRKGQDPEIAPGIPEMRVLTFSPGAGLTVRAVPVFRASLAYRLNKSSGDAETFSENLSLDLSLNHRYGNAVVRTKYEASRDPDFSTLEVSADLNLEL